MVRRPDIVLIFRVRGGDKKLPAVFVPLGKGDDRRILILEISYTALGLMSARTEDKQEKEVRGYFERIERRWLGTWSYILIYTGVGNTW
eukprot:6728386-Pyramimonas_sp.AAC.1